MITPVGAFRLARSRERRACRNAQGLFSRQEGRVVIRAGDEGRVVAEVESPSLVGADLSGRQLERSSLWGADLRDTDFSGAQLRYAWLRDVQAEGARFCRADLQGAVLDGGDFRGADFCGADLRHAVLHGADFRGAVYNGSTRWPVGFRPASRGCVLIADTDCTMPSSPIPAQPSRNDTSDLPVTAQAPSPLEAGVRDAESRLIGRR